MRWEEYNNSKLLAAKPNLVDAMYQSGSDLLDRSAAKVGGVPQSLDCQDEQCLASTNIMATKVQVGAGVDNNGKFMTAKPNLVDSIYNSGSALPVRVADDV